jgi:ubiquinone/menaquinone biosynthesis C-methylase UbiE
MTDLTPRQQRERSYHAGHAEEVRRSSKPVTYEVIKHPNARWWNHYWCAYSTLLQSGVAGRILLVPGCGDGTDPIRCARAGAKVSAFDLSPEMLRLAVEASAAEGVEVDFLCMPAERLDYADNTFEMIFVRDLLHHCDIPLCLSELKRVAKHGAFVVIDELYTHRALQAIRNSWLGRSLYNIVRPVIYRGEKPYITDDERKIDQYELDLIRALLRDVKCDYFNFVVARFIPDSVPAQIVDRAFAGCLGPLGRCLAGRVLLAGHIAK